jgi:hypothetical protein
MLVTSNSDRVYVLTLGELIEVCGETLVGLHRDPESTSTDRIVASRLWTRSLAMQTAPPERLTGYDFIAHRVVCLSW